MRHGDYLKSYISYFQSQLAKVSLRWECFCIRIHQRAASFSPLYKHLLKHDVTRMSEVLSRAQLCIHLEEAIKSSTNHSVKRGDDGEKFKPQYEATIGARNPNRGNTPTIDRLSWFHWVRFYFPSTWSSTPLRTNRGSGARNQSGAILHILEQKSTVFITIVKGTRSSTAGASENI